VQQRGTQHPSPGGSIAAGTPVSLSDELPAIDDRNAALVIQTVAHAAGQTWLSVSSLAALAALLPTLDKFLRSTQISAALTTFLAATGQQDPGYYANLLIDELSFTALRIGQVTGADNRPRRRPKEMHSPQHTERKAEAAARTALRGAGCRVVNVNRAIRRNYPVIDLVARRGTTRILVQVRGTWTVDGKFTATPAQSCALAALAASRGCHAIWAFVHITSNGTTVRFATAAQVMRLAEEDEATTPGTNRYNVNITQFEIDASRIAELLND